jgi:hypothetical protein
LIISLEFKSKFLGFILIILNQGEKKSVVEYGHDENEWGFKDDSEKIEWEEHYQSRKRKFEKDDDTKDEEL